MSKATLFVLSLITGLLLALSWPSIADLPTLLFIGLAPLLYVCESEFINNKKSISGYSFVSFFTFNLLTTWWIYCVTESIETKIFVVAAAVLVNTIMMTLVFQLFHYTRFKLGEIAGYTSLIAFWLGFEYLHLSWDLSWPWLNLGNGFANQITWIQWYEYTGTAGGTIWILMINIFVFKTIKTAAIDGLSIAYNKQNLFFVTLGISVPICCSLIKYSTYEEKGSPIEVVVVQPNMDPYNEKYDLSQEEQLEKLLSLGKEKLSDSTIYIVAPETAISDGFWENDLEASGSTARIREFLSDFPNCQLVTGVSSYYLFEENEKPSITARNLIGSDRKYDAYNSAFQFNNSPHIEIYHKSKLVQGVEMTPFEWLLKPLSNLSLDLGGITGSLGKQDEPSVFRSIDGERSIAPIICYESIYGEYIGKYVNKGASLLCIMTNDGWWKKTPGHKQHLAYARLRAVETRRPVARAANTGISAFINQRGDILQQTEWWTETAIKQTIQPNTQITFYTKYGDYLGRTSAFLSIAILLYALVTGLRRK